VRAPSFSDLTLPDAVLVAIEVLWSEKLCRIQLSAFVEHGQPATSHLLEFHGVTKLALSHNESWGPSQYILCSAEVNGIYQLQMQSGDNIEVEASGFSFNVL
jgi:hypothetical protein